MLLLLTGCLENNHKLSPDNIQEQSLSLGQQVKNTVLNVLSQAKLP